MFQAAKHISNVKKYHVEFPDSCLKSSTAVLKQNICSCSPFRELSPFCRGDNLSVLNIHGSNLFLINIMYTLYNVTDRLISRQFLIFVESLGLLFLSRLSNGIYTDFSHCFGIFLFAKQVLKMFISAVLIVFKFLFRSSYFNRSWPAAFRDGRFSYIHTCMHTYVHTYIYT